MDLRTIISSEIPPLPKTHPGGTPPKAANSLHWEELFKSRGAKSSRDKRRLEHSLAQEFKGLKCDDKKVVRLLELLATSAPMTKISLRVRGICRQLLDTDCSSAWGNSLVDLLNLKVNPGDYSSPELYFWDNQLVKLLSKYPFEGYADEGRENALRSFLECEQINTLTNQRWATQETTPEIEEVCRRLEWILGDTPPTIKEVIDKGGWGPGTVCEYSYDRTMTGPEFKFGSTPSLTQLLIPIATMVTESVPLWDSFLRSIPDRQKRYRLVPGSKYFTVPKKFRMDRSACSEPQLNVFLQIGVGRIIRDRLRSAEGVDLRRSSDENRRLAFEGSITGLFATVDLENASNHLCRAPIRSVLSSDWYSLLSHLACDQGLLPVGLLNKIGAQNPPEHRFHMLSSMGNGFTFELETVLFRAIVTSIVPGVWSRVKGKTVLTWPHVAVFGDDLVFPTQYVSRVTELLTLFGLRVNRGKTFTSGPFRESCGLDSFQGVLVRPLYITKRLDSGETILSLANRVLSFAFEGPFAPLSGAGNSRWLGMWRDLQSHIPLRLRKLISTPPTVPHGLWVLGSSDWETPTGEPVGWRVIAPVSVRVDLSSYSLSDFLDVGDEAPVVTRSLRLDGDNLYAARLSQMQSSGGIFPSDPCMRSSGDSATLRTTVAHKAVYSYPVEKRQWLSWD